MSTFYVKRFDDTEELVEFLYLFAEHDGEAEGGWSRYRCKPEDEEVFEEYTNRKQVLWA